MNVLFLSAGRRIELIQCFIRAKEELGFEGKILAADASPLAPALYFADKYFIIPHIKSDRYLSELYNICVNENVALMIPTIDTELPVLAELKEEFSTINTRVLVSDKGVIDICRNKYTTYRFFKEIGLATPEIYVNWEDVPDVYPMFIKPVDGSSSINAFKVENKNELQLFYHYIANPIIQEYIAGEEYTIDVMCDFDGLPLYITPRKRLAVRSGEVSKTQIVRDVALRDEVIKIIDTLKPVGPITVQAIKSYENKKNYFIEINARFGGGAPLSIMAGADSPKALLKMLNGDKIEVDLDCAKADLFFLRYDQSMALVKKGDGYVKV